MIEEQPVNTILATMHATDADSTISEYQLIDADEDDNGSEFFEINNVTGEFKLRTCEGGEKNKIYAGSTAKNGTRDILLVFMLEVRGWVIFYWINFFFMGWNNFCSKFKFS